MEAKSPGDPCYTLRRVWLSAEEERGYYLGFARYAQKLVTPDQAAA